MTAFWIAISLVALLGLLFAGRPHLAWVAAAGAVLLVATLLPGTPSVRRGRLGDVVETLSLLALLPLLVVATGVLSAIGG